MTTDEDDDELRRLGAATDCALDVLPPLPADAPEADRLARAKHILAYRDAVITGWNEHARAIREEGARLSGSRNGASTYRGFETVSDDAATRIKFVTDTEITCADDQVMLVDGVALAGATILMHSQPGHAKTTLALDLAFALASGRPWHGRRVAQGSVVYIAAEGQAGLRSRVEAWKRHHDAEGDAHLGVNFVTAPLDPLRREDMDALAARLREMPEPPVLIVIDTWSACLAVGGGDEDRTRDTVRALAALRAVAGPAAMLILHHQGHGGGKRPRGSSALRAAADTEIALDKKKGDVVVLDNTKQRDLVPFAPIRLRLRPIDLQHGRSACVLDDLGHNEPAAGIEVLPENAVAALRALAGFPDASASFTQWQTAAKLSESTFLRRRDDLVNCSYVEHDATSGAYRITPEGKSYLHLHPTSNEPSVEANTIHHHQPSPPRRGEGGGGEGGDVGSEEEPSSPTDRLRTRRLGGSTRSQC